MGGNIRQVYSCNITFHLIRILDYSEIRMPPRFLETVQVIHFIGALVNMMNDVPLTVLVCSLYSLFRQLPQRVALSLEVFHVLNCMVEDSMHGWSYGYVFMDTKFCH